MQIIQRNPRGKAPQWQVSCTLQQNTRDYEAEHKAKDTLRNESSFAVFLFYINGNCISLHFVLFRQNKISSWSPGWKRFFCYLWSFHKHITNKDVQPADDQFKQATEEIKPS